MDIQKIMNPKLRKSFICLGIGVIVFIVITALSIMIAGIPTFQIDLIPGFIGISISFVVLFIVLWLKFAKNEDVLDTDERYN